MAGGDSKDGKKGNNAVLSKLGSLIAMDGFRIDAEEMPPAIRFHVSFSLVGYAIMIGLFAFFYNDMIQETLYESRIFDNACMYACDRCETDARLGSATFSKVITDGGWRCEIYTPHDYPAGANAVQFNGGADANAQTQWDTQCPGNGDLPAASVLYGTAPNAFPIDYFLYGLSTVCTREAKVHTVFSAAGAAFGNCQIAVGLYCALVKAFAPRRLRTQQGGGGGGVEIAEKAVAIMTEGA
jgi:hypothetical protein